MADQPFSQLPPGVGARRLSSCPIPCLYARGATDDKGQLFVHIEALLATVAALPVVVVVLAGGEEEIGSPYLAP